MKYYHQFIQMTWKHYLQIRYAHNLKNCKYQRNALIKEDIKEKCHYLMLQELRKQKTNIKGKNIFDSAGGNFRV